MEKQNITISLPKQIIRKAKVLAASRETSISRLVAEQIETLVGDEEIYQKAKRSAMATLEHGFRLGGKIRSARDEWHER